MRKSFSFLTFVVLYLSLTSPAMAEKYYFYKEAGKKLPSGQRYDFYAIPNLKEKLAGEIFLDMQLPKEPRNTHKEFSLGFDCAVDSRSTDPNKYWLFIENLAIRDDHQIYPLERVGPDPALLKPLAIKNLGPEIVKKLQQNELVNGRLKSRYEVEVRQGDSIGENLTFKASVLPKRLYLDYKFRIRKEGGSEEVFEGTIPLELASYNVGWLEKSRW